MRTDRHPRMTYRVDLPGGQSRLRDAVLYVSKKYAEAERFGLVKLNKTIWKADFDAFRDRHQPVTGRQYLRQKDGPVPFEMRHVIDDLLRCEFIRLESRVVNDFAEKRVIPQVDPSLREFSPADISYLDRAVKFYWDYTGTEASDHSHGVAWRTRSNGDEMPYELAYLSDEEMTDWEKRYFATVAERRGWQSH